MVMETLKQETAGGVDDDVVAGDTAATQAQSYEDQGIVNKRDSTLARHTAQVEGSTGSTGYSCPTLFNFYGDVHDCRKFYRCFWGEAFAFYCPDGTRWSQVLLTCDHEYNVPCHGAGPAYNSNPTTPHDQSAYVDYDSNDYGGGDHGDHSSSSSYDDYNSYDKHGDQSYHYKSFNDDGYNSNNYNNAYNDGYNSGYQHSGHTSSGYYDGGHHQTQTLSYGHQQQQQQQQPRIAYYDYNGYPSYISYNYDSQPYYHHNNHNNFRAYNNFMAGLGYKKK
nr:hypothetical protein BaRGS_007986 [Batillaria attramentaria]